MKLLTIAHALVALWLAAYGLQSCILLFLYLRWRLFGARAEACPPRVEPAAWPHVVVQIPVYNERHVVERAIDAAAALDYPRDRLHIQILDDSTDETTRLALARAAFHRERGVDVAVLRRPERDGFKAGALAWGLTRAAGEYVAIFDADFRPPPDFLRRTLPHFLARPRLGFVQTRWTHLNADYSALTHAQALAIDGHFTVEQAGRNRGGLLMSFNGAGGVWRRRCIEEAGGWQADTLCEDLDLSYRAQLAGWDALYLPEVETPGELPPQMAALKRQQARWAQGSVQTLRKLCGPILRSRRLNGAQKAMALLHLSTYLAHPLMVIALLLSLPLLLAPDAAAFPLDHVGWLGLGPLAAIAFAQWGRRADRLRALPLLMLIGVGLAWSNTCAALRGLTRWGGEFARTPKFRLEGREGGWAGSDYRLGMDAATVGEVALAGYALLTALAAHLTGHAGLAPFMLIYAAAFGAVAGMGLTQARAPSRAGASPFQKRAPVQLDIFGRDAPLDHPQPRL